jgi:long-chain acyl-CoA synthetase
MSYQPRFSSLVDMLEGSVANHADKPVFGVRRDEGWRWTSYRDFGSQVARLRAGLATLGIKRGERVAVISNNRLEWAIGAFASYSLGAIWVPMYESQLDEDWTFILNDCGAHTCLVSGESIAKRVRNFAGQIASLQHVIDFDAPGDKSFAGLLAAGDAAPVPSIKPAPDDVAELIYTSGTTGKPKGVRLTHMNLASNVSGFCDIVPLDGTHRSLAFLPWAHVYGGNVEVNGMLSIGASMAICEKRERILEYIAEVKPTVLFAVPQIWNRIYAGVQANVAEKPAFIRNIFANGMRCRTKQKRGEATTLGERLSLSLAKALIFGKVKQRFGGALKFACSGAAALSPDVAEFVDNLGIDVYEGYGMTECSGIGSANQPGQRRIGTVGKALPGVTISLDHEAPGSDAENGEIVIGGPGIMAGYYNLPDETSKVMTPSGGLRTGDLGRFDKEGFLVVTGRVKELYKLQNGKYVAPAPLEEKLALSPFISQVMVHGADKPYNVAVIVPNFENAKKWANGNGVDADAKALLASPRMRELIAAELDKYSTDWKSYERVKRFLLLPEEFTTGNDMLTPTLKVKRRNVLKRYGSDIDKLYS